MLKKKYKTRILIFIVLIMIWPSFADNKENDPALEFVVFYQAADTSTEHFWEAYSDLEHHTRSASKYFDNSQFKIVTKEENQQDWYNLIPKKPFGFVVLYGKKELLRMYEVMPDIAIIQEAGKALTKIRAPKWLSGTWAGSVGFEHELEEIEVQYSFDFNKSQFQVKYANYQYPILLIVDSVATDFARFRELHNDDIKEIRDFGTDMVEMTVLKKDEVLHVQYKAGENNKLGIGQVVKKR